MVCEYDGRWDQAARYRKEEAKLIFRLYDSFTDEQGPDVREFALQGHKKGDVSRRLSCILETYERNAGAAATATIDRLRLEFKRR